MLQERDVRRKKFCTFLVFFCSKGAGASVSCPHCSALGVFQHLKWQIPTACIWDSKAFCPELRIHQVQLLQRLGEMKLSALVGWEDNST